MKPITDPYDTRDEDAAAKAKAILREDEPLNPLERAAMDAINEKAWVLWHTSTMLSYAHGVIRLLSTAHLLRDKKHEDHQAKSLFAEERAREDRKARTNRLITRLDTVITQAADALRKGEDPIKVAEALENHRDRDRGDKQAAA
ncbi:hypothetical protein ACFYMO_03730 [Streptomyces sp. NPDC007025]|uniref:hypothetical protein n=1 Tax=Streptomyces sp. NPDC007025 TaxID=3364771 RepID=UPI003692444D